MPSLRHKHCIPCHPDNVRPYTLEEARAQLPGVPTWLLNETGTEISRRVATKNFTMSLALANQIGGVAESEGHHPDLTVSWGSLGIKLSSHAIKGLSENDFIMAAKIDQLLA